MESKNECLSLTEVVHSYFLNDGPQRHVAGKSVYSHWGQLHHAATVGAF